ncbi:MAG: hypothetical protein QM775_07080 [Pirellulales bacterium]
MLARQIGLPGYDELLAIVDRLPVGYEQDFPLVAELLSRGAASDDVCWACEHDVARVYRIQRFLTIPAVRRLATQFAVRGHALTSDELGRLVLYVTDDVDKAAVTSWLRWLGAVAASTITPRLRRLLWPTFFHTYFEFAKLMERQEFPADVLAPLRRRRDPDDDGPLMERIIDYQRNLGAAGRMPKSLRKLCDVRLKRAAERRHLQKQADAGLLKAAAAARLRRLEQNDDGEIDRRKFCRTAEEAYLLLGRQALEADADRLAEDECRRYCGDFTAELPHEHLRNFALWLHGMAGDDRDRLKRLLAARTQSPRTYKRMLDDNQAWIARAEIHGINLEPWFNGPQQNAMIDGREIELTITPALQHVFLMGTYFGSCLSLNGMNAMSVLSNASDANKQVVFLLARNDRGRQEVVARQLLAITDNFELVGYCFYVGWRLFNIKSSGVLLDAMARYCGRLAAQCGLTLADEGTPSAIGRHFWYDDGTHPWTDAAKDAYAANTSYAAELV